MVNGIEFIEKKNAQNMSSSLLISSVQSSSRLNQP
jgi:hypothetical protein